MRVFPRGTLLLCGLLPAFVWAQPALYLKSGRSIAPSFAAGTLARAASLPSDEAGHIILQFASQPGAAEIRELTARGALVLDYISDNAVLISTRKGLSTEGLNVVWSGRLRASDKLSSKLEYRSELVAVAEFHRDTPPERMRALVLEAGLAVRENPDLLAHQLLLQGDPNRLWQLADADEVAYVYPASSDLIAGVAVSPCAGPMTSAGHVGQYTARVGDGWDGPGRNAAALRYVLGALTAQMTPEDIRHEVLRAMHEWSRYVQVSFSEGGDPQAERTVAIMFARGDHGDGYPFDGPGGTLAHTFYPAPPNPESIAGDLHLDGDESWQIGRSRDLYSVVLHELGHALGLGHSDNPGAVMYPFYRLSDKLSDEDIQAIRELYAPQDDSAPPLTLSIQRPSTNGVTTEESAADVAGTVSGGTGSVAVSWISDSGTGQTSVAEGDGERQWDLGLVPLALGANRITVSAAAANGATVFSVVQIMRQQPAPPDPPSPDPPKPPVVQILNPSAGITRTLANAITLSGIAAHPSGIDRVEWREKRGVGGTALGTTNWSSGAVNLENGVNVFTVTAWSRVGTSASATIEVDFIVRPPTAPDASAPSLTITSPASTNVSTAGAVINVRGYAQDNVGVTQITWSTSTGASGKALGTGFFGPLEIPLLVGTNTIAIRAYDEAGNVSWRSITVTRR
ncbi:MAG: matrixin family metalloprotease [Bryobacteraceae bacterium]